MCKQQQQCGTQPFLVNPTVTSWGQRLTDSEPLELFKNDYQVCLGFGENCCKISASSSPSRHSRAARASQTCATKRSSTMSARPHCPDTVGGCQLKQETVSTAQMGEMGFSPHADGDGVARGTGPAAPPYPRGTEPGRLTAAGAEKPRSSSLPTDFLCSFQSHNILIDISCENSTGAT